MHHRLRQTTTLIAAASIAALLLTGCSTSGPAGGDASAVAANATATPGVGANVWTFGKSRQMTEKKSITFRIDPDLLKIATDYDASNIFTAVTTRSTPVDDPGTCAVEYTYTFAAHTNLDQIKADYAKRFESLGLTDDEIAAGVLGFDGHARVPKIGVPTKEDITDASVWIAPDDQSAVIVRDCAADPFDEDAADLPVEFPYVSETSDGMQSLGVLADASVTVMKNGDLAVTESDVDDFTLDSTGTWIAD